MTKSFSKYLLGGALALSALAVPGFANQTITLAFSNGGVNGGSITGSGSTLSTLSNVPYSILAITGAGALSGNYTLHSGGTGSAVLNLASNVFTLSGGITGGPANTSNLANASGHLLTFSNNGTTATFLPSAAQISFNSSTNLGAVATYPELFTLFQDLNFNTNNLSSLSFVGGGVSDSSGPVEGAYTATSDTLTINATFATPEPGTFLLFGSSLLAAGLFRRKKSPLAGSK